MNTTTRRSQWLAATLALAGLSLLPLVACSDDKGGDSDTAADTADTTDTGDTGDTTVAAETDCDPLDPSACALPWPSNLYLVDDSSRATGFTLTFGATTLPANRDGTHIDPTHYSRRDGYGLESPLLVKLGDVDVSALATEFDLAPSMASDAPVVWLEVGDTGDTTRVPWFVDVDVTETDPSERVLIIRPAVILKEDTRYVVGFRGLKDTAGAAIAASDAFTKLRDGAAGDDPALSGRVARFEDLFQHLVDEGVDRSTLQLAWDFHTASSDSLHGWMLDARDKALAAVGATGPEITITEVITKTVEEDANIALELVGTFKVPNFMKQVPSPTGATIVVYEMNTGPDGMPLQDGWAEAPLWVRVPRVAINGDPQGMILYGHGQNGRGSQVRGGHNSRIAQEYGFVFAATDMWGMAEEDVNGIIDVLLDFSGFTRLSDRLIQGVVNHVLLARAMKVGFPTLTELVDAGVTVDTTDLSYSGISQGGIYGPTIVATSPDITRGHLGVPGNQYAFLLTHSQNFDVFFQILKNNYIPRTDQVISLQAIQLLWDQADPVSYLRRIHNPLPGSPENAIMLVPAKGDPQVAVTSNELVVRSDIGISVLENYDDEREIPMVTPVSYPHTGSGVVLYDFGNPWPAPSVNAPPTSDLPDPHSKPRNNALHSEQLVTFLRTGEIIDVCGGDGCIFE